MTDIASRMAEVRTRLGLTQRDMAEKLSIPYRTLQDGERGIAQPGAATLAAYADHGVDLNWLVTGAKVADATPPSNQLDDQAPDKAVPVQQKGFEIALAGVLSDQLWASVEPSSLLESIQAALKENRVNPAYRTEYEALVRFRERESN